MNLSIKILVYGVGTYLSVTVSDHAHGAESTAVFQDRNGTACRILESGRSRVQCHLRGDWRAVQIRNRVAVELASPAKAIVQPTPRPAAQVVTSPARPKVAVTRVPSTPVESAAMTLAEIRRAAVAAQEAAADATAAKDASFNIALAGF